jgi:hypothetical protein
MGLSSESLRLGPRRQTRIARFSDIDGRTISSGRSGSSNLESEGVFGAGVLRNVLFLRGTELGTVEEAGGRSDPPRVARWTT